MSAAPHHSGLRLRRAEHDDIPWLAEFGARTFRTAYTGLLSDAASSAYCALAYGIEQQTAELARADSLMLVAELDGGRVGFAWLTRAESAELPACVTDPTAVNLSRIYVDPAVQSHGIGARLIEGALVEARGLGGDMLWLAVWKRNPRAIAFYQRHGFSEIGCAGFPADEDPECDFVMARWLGACC